MPEASLPRSRKSTSADAVKGHAAQGGETPKDRTMASCPDKLASAKNTRRPGKRQGDAALCRKACDETAKMDCRPRHEKKDEAEKRVRSSKGLPIH